MTTDASKRGLETLMLSPSSRRPATGAGAPKIMTVIMRWISLSFLRS